MRVLQAGAAPPSPEVAWNSVCFAVPGKCLLSRRDRIYSASLSVYTTDNTVIEWHLAGQRASVYILHK